MLAQGVLYVLLLEVTVHVLLLQLFLELLGLLADALLDLGQLLLLLQEKVLAPFLKCLDLFLRSLLAHEVPLQSLLLLSDLSHHALR